MSSKRQQAAQTSDIPDHIRLAIALGEIDDGSHWHQLKLKARAIGVSKNEILRMTEAELAAEVGDFDNTYADWEARTFSK